MKPAVDRFFAACGIAALLGAAATILLVLVDIVNALAGGEPIAWTFAATQYVVVLALAAGIPWLLKRRGYERFLDLCGVVAGLVLAGIALIVTTDVVFRNLGFFTFPWVMEVAEYSIYAATMLAAPWVLHLGAHVRVDVLVNAVSRATARRMDLAADMLGLLASAVLFYYGSWATIDAYLTDSYRRVELVVAEWWLLILIPFTCVFLIVEFIFRIRRTLGSGAIPAPGEELSDGL